MYPARSKMVVAATALVFAWAFEMTPEGLKREKDVDRSQSITHKTGHTLDRSIIAILVVALGYFAYERFIAPDQGSEPVSAGGRSAAESRAERAPTNNESTTNAKHAGKNSSKQSNN